AQPGRQVGILDPDGRVLGPGLPGALAVRRDDPGLYLGYLDQPGDTQERMLGEWFLTGDQAVTGEDGAITLLGRGDDIMNAGGYRVAPPEIEEVLASHPGAGDVAVTELAVGAGSSIIAAFWTGDAVADDLRAMAEARLARYKQPRDYIRLDALPRTPTGKINRRALRESHRKDRT